ncbi:MAG TPA: methyltransferase domain-containing protein [Candidatus Omnitrophica bacterium]|nr:methyltransferase domain-containing protein [Candidatus Omnitrophota bacterium]
MYDIDDKEKYSVVLVMDVLEHLEKPEEALKKIYNILNPQGFLYMNIPICDSLSLRLWRLLSGQTRAELVRGCDETHLNSYSKRELINLLRRVGFKIVKAQRLANRFPIVGRFSSKLSDFLQQFNFWGVFGDLLAVIAERVK